MQRGDSMYNSIKKVLKLSTKSIPFYIGFFIFTYRTVWKMYGIGALVLYFILLALTMFLTTYVAILIRKIVNKRKLHKLGIVKEKSNVEVDKNESR